MGQRVKQLKNQILHYLICGMGMGGCAVGISMLISSSARKTIAIIILLMLFFVGVNYFCLQLVHQEHRRKGAVVCVGLAVINIVLLISVTVYSIAPSLLFYPNFDEASYQSLSQNETAEEIELETEQGELGGWILHNAEANAPVVLYFAGNGESASKRMYTILAQNLDTIFTGYNIVIFDYPGYGKSSGTSSETSLKQMGLDVFDTLALRDDVNPEKIYLFGYSMGTGVANYVASKREVAGLVLMAPYANGYDLYNSIMNIFYGPMRLLVGFRMEADNFAQSVEVEPMILASEDDEFVPYESSLELSRVYPVGCQLETLQGIGHNEFWGTSVVQQKLSDYFQEELK